MAKIELTTAELLAQSQEMASLSQEYTDAFNGMTSLLGTVNTNWSSNLAHNFEGKITTAGKSFSSLSGMLSEGANLANKSATTFESVDSLMSKSIANGESSSGSTSGAASSIWKKWGDTYQESNKDGIIGSNTRSGSIAEFGSEDEGAYMRWGNFKTEGSTESTAGGKKKFDDRKRTVELAGRETDGAEYYDLKNDRDLTEEESGYYKKKGTVLEIKGEKSASVSVFETGISGEADWGNGSTSVTVGEAEVHASASAGLYVMDKNGNKVLAPSANVEVGGSITAISATAEGQLGNDMLGVNGSVTATAGKASAQASATASLFDQNGYISPQLEAGGSLEAIAAEASATVGANILGGGVSATGTVNVGIGAHADIGYKGGVLKCDIGASVGIGASVSFEVDVGGMAQTLVSDAKGALKEAGKTVDAVKDAASSALSKLKWWK